MDGCCGSGMVLMLNKDHIFNLWMGGGKGSNTRVELMGLWGVLKFDALNGIVSLTFFGNSKVIIEWE